jgi:hypothetical protein
MTNFAETNDGSEGSVFPSLERLEGLSRSEIMKLHIAEPLSRLIKSVYSPIESYEVNELLAIDPEPITLRRFTDWTSKLADLVQKRAKYIDIPKELEDINRQRRVFFWRNCVQPVRDGVRSGVVVPAVIASHIALIEGYLPENNNPDTNYGLDPIIKASSLVEIMNRPIFDRMLSSLTQGPNGFLGLKSSDATLMRNFSFFSFEKSTSDNFLDEEGGFISQDPRMLRHPLRFHEAYKLEAGEVVGFSDAYYLAANKIRRTIRESNQVSDYQAADSAGCPMRFQYADEEGHQRQSLVVEAKEFVVNALTLCLNNKARIMVPNHDIDSYYS